MNQVSVLKSITEKTRRLIEQHQAVKKEKDRLVAELEKLKTALSDQRSLCETLTNQLAAAQIKTTGMDDSEKKAFEKKINHYIKEIDRCISQLGQ